MILTGTPWRNLSQKPLSANLHQWPVTNTTYVASISVRSRAHGESWRIFLLELRRADLCDYVTPSIFIAEAGYRTIYVGGDRSCPIVAEC